MYSFGDNLRYIYDTGGTSSSSHPPPCPGYYCGRTQFENNQSWSSCGPCPRGFQRTNDFSCQPCDKELYLYDWLYLGFMALLPIIFHLGSIDDKRFKSTKDTLGLVLCAIIEICISSSAILLVWDPVGSFQIKACGVSHLSDWYPIFFNPQPNYENYLHCSHEVVYPLYTLVLVFYAVSDFLMILIRIIAHFLGVKVSTSIYAGLYFYPLLALCHLIFGGLVYYIFPYLTIVGSVVSCAYHFAKRPNQEMTSLVVESIKDWRNAGIIICHWFLHAYGIISITQLYNLKRDLSLLALVPAPALLYIITVNFTDPAKFHNE